MQGNGRKTKNMKFLMKCGFAIYFSMSASVNCLGRKKLQRIQELNPQKMKNIMYSLTIL